MHFWPAQRVQDFENLDFSGLQVKLPDLAALSQLKDDVRVRNLIEDVLCFLCRYNVQFHFPSQGSSRGMAHALKNAYAASREVPFQDLNPFLSDFVHGMQALFSQMYQFGVLGFDDGRQDSLTLFDWFDRYERLAGFQADFQSGIHARRRGAEIVPIGKPYVPYDDPYPVTLAQSVRQFAPGYDPIGTMHSSSQGLGINPEYRRYSGIKGRLLSAVGFNKPYRFSDVRSFLPVLQSSLLPQLEQALGHYVTARTYVILENLFVVRANINQILLDPTLDHAQQSLRLEGEVVTGFAECSINLKIFTNIRRQLYACLTDLKDQTSRMQSRMTEHSSSIPEEVLIIKQLLSSFYSMLYPASPDVFVDPPLHQTLGAGANDTYEPAFRDYDHTGTDR